MNIVSYCFFSFFLWKKFGKMILEMERNIHQNAKLQIALTENTEVYVIIIKAIMIDSSKPFRW